jgi:cupin 2 domain-containing protein
VTGPRRPPGNLFSPGDPSPESELVEVLAGGVRDPTQTSTGSLRIERIVSRGHSSPEGFWYEQEEDEWVALLQGEARLQFRDPEELVELQPGDHLLIPAHRPHRVAWTTPEAETIWLAVFHRPGAL